MSYFSTIYSDSSLPIRAKTVYMYLRDRSDKERKCWPGINTIAAELNCSRSTVKRALHDHNLEVDERRIDYGDFWNGPTLEAMQRFVDSGIPMPEAVVCANDVMALAVEEFLEQRGFQVPEDIMITGYDGIPEAVNHQPHIATAGRDITEVTRQVFDILKELFDGKTFPDNYIHKIDANLQLYGSCGCDDSSI